LPVILGDKVVILREPCCHSEGAIATEESPVAGWQGERLQCAALSVQEEKILRRPKAEFHAINGFDGRLRMTAAGELNTEHLLAPG